MKQFNDEQEEINEANQENQEVLKIPLMKFPRTICFVWTEFEFEIGGDKPAKYFTSRERYGIICL